MKMSIVVIIGIIIILVLILAIVISVYVGVFKLQKKIRHTSRELFGTEDITQAASQMRKDYATTPKSVSAMTSLLLPRIVNDFPDFEYDEMKERANNVLTSYLRAVDANSIGTLKDGNAELKNQLENQLQMLAVKDYKEHYEQIKLHQTEINQYRKTDGRCIITFQTSLECFHYITNIDGKVIDGSKEYKYQTKYNTDMIYIQDRDIVENENDAALAINCPNCGAPLSGVGAKFCEFCGSPIVEFNIRAWSFSNIDEIR